MRISIIITSYNQREYLREAINSALAVRWPDREVIVVDDGSTDGSDQVLRSFGDRVVAIFKANGGQNSAANAGWEAATGDVFFFLDSDDCLYPDAAEVIAKTFRPGVTKVQFPLDMTSNEGVPKGYMTPSYPKGYGPTDVKRSRAITGWYLTSPTTGNAWSRDFIDRVFPLPTMWTHDVPALYFDGYLSTLAAELGDIITLPFALGMYRVKSNAGKTFFVEGISENCIEDVARIKYLSTKLASLGIKHVPPLVIAYPVMMSRIVCRKFNPQHYPLPLESWPEMILQCYRSVYHDINIGWKPKVLLFGWFTAIAILPRPTSVNLIRMRYWPAYRPPLVLALLRASGWQRGH